MVPEAPGACIEALVPGNSLDIVDVGISGGEEEVVGGVLGFVKESGSSANGSNETDVDLERDVVGKDFGGIKVVGARMTRFPFDGLFSLSYGSAVVTTLDGVYKDLVVARLSNSDVDSTWNNTLSVVKTN